MIKFLFRICLVAIAVAYVLPKISGVNVHGDFGGAVATSLIFNISFVALEWLLGIVVFGINIGTLGLGVLITNALKFVASIMMPSLALFGTSQLLPKFLHISDYFPSAFVAGLVLGGLLWASLPDKSRK